MIDFYNYIDLYIIVSSILFILIIVFTLFSSGISFKAKKENNLNNNNDIKRKYYIDKFSENKEEINNLNADKSKSDNNIEMLI